LKAGVKNEESIERYRAWLERLSRLPAGAGAVTRVAYGREVPKEVFFTYDGDGKPFEELDFLRGDE
jgi:hypothetical protein